MKLLLSTLVAGALLASMFSAAAAPRGARAASAQDPVVQAPLEARVAALEGALGAEKARHDETRALLEATLAYLDRQAKGADSMLATLDASEQAGFTSGINFNSREILLRGFRDFWGGVRSDVPRSKPARKPAPAPVKDKAPATPPPAEKPPLR